MYVAVSRGCNKPNHDFSGGGRSNSPLSLSRPIRCRVRSDRSRKRKGKGKGKGKRPRNKTILLYRYSMAETADKCYILFQVLPCQQRVQARPRQAQIRGETTTNRRDRRLAGNTNNYARAQVHSYVRPQRSGLPETTREYKTGRAATFPLEKTTFPLEKPRTGALT